MLAVLYTACSTLGVRGVMVARSVEWGCEEYKDLVFNRAVEPGAERLGNALSDARRGQGLTQAGLASRVGLTQQAIAHYEAGHVPPPPILYLVARALRRSPYELLRGVETQLDSRWKDSLASLISDRQLQALSVPADSIAACQNVLREALDTRRSGRPDEAQHAVEHVIRTLEQQLPERRDDVDLATVLWQAHAIHAATVTELYSLGVHTVVMSDCAKMLTLAKGPLRHWAEAEAGAHYRQADILMLSGSPQHLARAWDAAQRSRTLTSDCMTKIHGLRVQAAILRRQGTMQLRALRRVVWIVDEETDRVDPLTQAFVKQGLSLNLLALRMPGQGESVRLIEEAESAYDVAYREGREDSHIWGLIQRTRAFLAAMPGNRFDPDAAQIYAEEGLDVARPAGRRRTARQCQAVLRMVVRGIAVSELPS